jgi:3-dehydroquinate dehydratase-1
MRRPAAPQIVGVISSLADFQRAIRMRNPPDLFEVRLDALGASIETVRNQIERLPAPVIVTARHPREGGANQLFSQERRDLLLQFGPHATFVDVELHSSRSLAEVLRAAGSSGLRTIISFHDLQGTPRAARLDRIMRAAQSLGADIVKIATRTDTPSQLERLLMGIGRLGRKSRLELARRGCALNYAHLGKPQTAGQLSVPELRRALKTRS